MSEKILIIDNVRSAYNVGSLFRTADGAGVSQVVLVGYTPTPLDRFGRVQAEIEKTSLGACNMIPWVSKTDVEILDYVEELKGKGWTIASLEQTPQSMNMYEFSVPAQIAYILGNEIEGVSKAILDVADVHLEIPMQGKKESLNVSVAGGIMLFYRNQ